MLPRGRHNGMNYNHADHADAADYTELLRVVLQFPKTFMTS